MVHGLSISRKAHDTVSRLNLAPIADGTITSATPMSWWRIDGQQDSAADRYASHLDYLPIDRHLALLEVYQVCDQGWCVVSPSSCGTRSSVSSIVSVQAADDRSDIVAGDVSCRLTVVCRVDLQVRLGISRPHLPRDRSQRDSRSKTLTLNVGDLAIAVATPRRHRHGMMLGSRSNAEGSISTHANDPDISHLVHKLPQEYTSVLRFARHLVTSGFGSGKIS